MYQTDASISKRRIKKLSLDLISLIIKAEILEKCDILFIDKDWFSDLKIFMKKMNSHLGFATEQDYET